MAVESVTYIGDLDPTAPAGASPKSEGDDHVRNLKAGVKKSFAGFTGAIRVTGTDGGAVNAYTLTPATPLPSYSAKMTAVFTPTATNTGACTLNISGLGIKNLKSVSGADLAAGELVAGVEYDASYNGTEFRLKAPTKKYVDALVTSGTVPGVDDPANAGKFFKAGGTWSSVDGRGSPFIDLGNSGTTAQVLTFSENAEGWKLKATGNFSLSTAGWPAGRLSGGLLKLENGGAFSMTTSGITWIKSDNTKTAIFADAGYTLQASGFNLLTLVTYGDGAVYGKLVG